MLKKIKAMLNHSKQEKTLDTGHDISVAVTALMIEIIHSDDKLEDAEQLVMMKAVKERFNLSDADIQTLIKEAHEATSNATDFHQFTSQIKDSYSTQERIAFLTDLWKIAMADGFIDSYEEHLIRRIANLIGIYHGEFIQAKIDARENT